MRALLFLAFLGLSPALALAEEVDAATLTAVSALATKGYANPAAAQIRNVHKSLARNGRGYCGEVTVEGGDGFTIFHAILAGQDGAGASVLRLGDFPDSDRAGLVERITVARQ